MTILGIKLPDLTGYQVVSLLLLTLVGLFLGVVSFASFGVLNVTQQPITLLTSAIEKLNHIKDHQDQKDAEQSIWRDLVITDHLFISGLIAEHVAQEKNITHGYTVNGSDIIFNDTVVPIPPSAHKFFTKSFNNGNGNTTTDTEGFSWPSPTSFKFLLD